MDTPSKQLFGEPGDGIVMPGAGSNFSYFSVMSPFCVQGDRHGQFANVRWFFFFRLTTLENLSP